MTVESARFMYAESVLAVIDGEQVFTTISDPLIADWVALGNTIAPYVAPVIPNRTISKRVLVERLGAAGLLSAAFTGLGGPGSLTYERWSASTYVDTTNTDVIALITTIGGNVATLLAPE